MVKKIINFLAAYSYIVYPAVITTISRRIVSVIMKKKKKYTHKQYVVPRAHRGTRKCVPSVEFLTMRTENIIYSSLGINTHAQKHNIRIIYSDDTRDVGI